MSGDAFAQSVAAWHDFYALVGEAAASLIGLLFVSLSLNAEVIARQENADLQRLARQSFGDFIIVLIFAMLFLIPRQSPQGLGWSLIGVDAAALSMTLNRLRLARHDRARPWGRRGLIARFVVPLIALAVVMIVAVSLLLSSTDGLGWLVPVVILLIFDASMNAWHLLFRLREPPKRL